MEDLTSQVNHILTDALELFKITLGEQSISKHYAPDA
jgi:hypothetical protein